jgi:hypothetical protein
MDDAPRLLLIGKRASVLTRLAQALRERGIEADQFQDLGGAGIESYGGYAAVVFGRAVKPADRERIRREFERTDPDVAFVDGYAPIIPLLVAQCEQALDRRPTVRRRLADLAVCGGFVQFRLHETCRLRVTAYRLDALYRPNERTVFDRDIGAGEHSIALGSHTARARNAFVVVRAGDETAVLPVPRDA